MVPNLLNEGRPLPLPLPLPITIDEIFSFLEFVVSGEAAILIRFWLDSASGFGISTCAGVVVGSLGSSMMTTDDESESVSSRSVSVSESVSDAILSYFY